MLGGSGVVGTSRKPKARHPVPLGLGLGEGKRQAMVMRPQRTELGEPSITLKSMCLAGPCLPGR